MQKQLTEIIIGHDQGIDCTVQFMKNGNKLPFGTFKPLIKNNLLKINQHIYDYLDNDTTIVITISDPSLDGRHRMQVINLLYRPTFDFASLTYKANDVFKFYGRFKVIKSDTYDKSLFEFIKE